MNIVILTGAGMSAESGIATFRGGSGIWEGHRIEDVCTPDALARNPDIVCGFYDDLRTIVAAASPNPGHIAVADLERHWHNAGNGSFLLVTQNVDDLHERAGSKSLIHMHGELNAASCMECGWSGPRHSALEDDRECAICERDALRPDIVLFSEAARQLARIDQALEACDLFVAIGTSGTVYPASDFVKRAKAAGARTMLFNTEPTESIDQFDDFKMGPCGVTLPEWVSEMT